MTTAPGALKVYRRAAGKLTIHGEAIGAMLATRAATVLMASREANDCESRLVGRDLIGQAKGILMSRSRVTDMSVQSVAHDIVTTV